MGEKSMSMPLIDPLPPAPTPADPEDVFDEKAYETVAALAPFVAQTNVLALAVEAEATRSESEADRSQAQVNVATTEANRAQTEAERAKDEADRAEQARDDAVSVVTEGQGSIEPKPGKFPVAGADAAIQQAWIKGLEFELDALRVARNKLLYGDGPYPVLDLQFQGAKYLDPRIQFTRATADWDEDGNEYGINEPVLTDQGLWVSGARTNLVPFNRDITNGWTLNQTTVSYDEARECSVLQPGTNSGFVLLSSANFVKDRLYTLQITIRPPQGEGIRNTVYLHRNIFGAGTYHDGCLIDKNGIISHTGNPIDLAVTELQDGWYKIKFSAIARATPTSPTIAIYIDARGTEGVPMEDIKYEIKDIQLEQGTATAVIPTSGSQVTVAPTFKSDDLSGIKTNEFTLMFYKQAHQPVRDASGAWLLSVDLYDSSNNRLFVLLERPNALTYSLASTTIASSATAVNGISDAGYMAITYRDGVLRLFFKGGLVIASSPPVNYGEIELGRIGYGAAPGELTRGYHKQTLFFDRALSDEEAKELTL